MIEEAFSCGRKLKKYLRSFFFFFSFFLGFHVFLCSLFNQSSTVCRPSRVIMSIDEKPNIPKIIITGFSVFPGVTKNPTELLIEKLSSKTLRNENTLYDILEVSAEGASERLIELQKQADRNTTWIHMGVNCRIDCFDIEEKAFNCANFRCPDVRGKTLKNELIVKDDISFARTSFPVLEIQNRLRSQFHKVNISQDAGRYLCNYVYFKSLYWCHKKYSHGRVLFIHVPPFTKISEDKQCKFIQDLMKVLQQSFEEDKNDGVVDDK